MLSESGIPVKGNVIVLGKNFSNLIKNLGDKPIVLLLGKKVVPVFVKDFAERSGAQNLFQPGPHRDPIFFLAGGEQQQYPIVFLFRTDSPVIEQLIGILFAVESIQKVHRHRDDLGAGLRLQQIVCLQQMIFGLLGED